MSNLLVIDNFLSELEAQMRRWDAVIAEYGTVSATGASYPGIARIPLASEDENTLSAIFGPREIQTFFRMTIPSMRLPTFIHNDVALAQRTAILYLNPKFKGGTALWRHKESGLERAPTRADLDRLGDDYMQKLIEDGTKENRWEMTEIAQGEFGRLVSFDADLWHSCYPRGGWGHGPSDGRLIQVYFLGAPLVVY